jgi:hypothetical protein
MSHTIHILLVVLLAAWAVTLVGLAVLGVRYRREQHRAIVRRISWYTAGPGTDA